MKPLPLILTSLMVFVTIFNSSFCLRCHSCTYGPKSQVDNNCSLKGGGPVFECTSLLKTKAIACFTKLLNDGTFSRGCLDVNGFISCMYPNESADFYYCHLCEKNACNTDDTF